MNTLLSKKARLPIAIAVLLVLSIALVSWFSRPTVQVYRAKRGTAMAAVYGTVKIEWTYSVGVRTQNAGYIQLAPGISSGQASIGIPLKKDQLLGTIVDEATSRQLNQAKIDLEAALASQRIGPPSVTLLQTAEDNLRRLQKLKELNAVPEQQFQQAENEVRGDSDKVKKEQIDIDTWVRTCQENLKNLEDNLSRSKIKSPLDGVLTSVNFSDGELVSENTVAFIVARNSTYVSGQVNEEDVGQIHTQMKAKVRLYSFPDNEFIATVSSILPYPDPNSQRYSVILALDHPPTNLMAGMTGEMNIIIGERPDALLIPTRALLGNKVFVIESGLVVPRLVKVGFRSLETVEILEGLNAGDKVVVEDQDLLKPGMRVRAIQLNPEQMKAAAAAR